MDTSNKAWEFPAFTKTIHRTSYPSIDPKNENNSASGRVVIVTGGGIGVGKGIAKAFVEAGAKAVAILGRREHILDEAKTELEKAGSTKILIFKADVLDESALNAAFEATEKEAGDIDIVVANAGYLSTPALATATDVADWWKSYEINIKGTLLTWRAFMKYKGSNSPTFISVNTAAAHVSAFPTFSSYQSSKIGEAQLICALQTEDPDVRVVSMHPGTIATDMNVKSNLPLSQDDMSLPAGFAVWLASPAGSWVGGRFFWSHWDVDELVKMKDEIIANNELTISLSGWPKNIGDPVVVW